MAPKGRGEDQRAATASEHRRNLIFGAEKRTGEVGFQRPRPVLTRYIDDASKLSHRCRIVERDIEPTELAGRQAYQLVRVAFVLDISPQGDRATAGRLNFRNQPVQFVRTAGADD